jgi:hypothetical protein
MLRKPKVMRIRRLAPTNQTGLLGHEFAVGLVPKPTRLRQREQALVDAVGIAASEGCHFCRKCVLDAPRIGCRQAVFCRHDPVRPRGGVFGRAQAIHVGQQLIAQCR